jgi:F-type H+-transporting ATPase subunit alpha
MPDGGSSLIKIVTPVELSPEQAEKLAVKFARLLGIKEHILRTEVDKSLLGGVVVYAGGYRYDYSIKGQLGRIAGKLKESKAIEDTAGSQEDVARLINESLAESLGNFNETPVGIPQDESLFGSEKVDGIQEASHGSLVDELYERFAGYRLNAAVDEVGIVVSVGDGIAKVSGIENCKSNEILMFSHNTYGIAMNLEEDSIGVVLLGSVDTVAEGMMCKRTGRTIDVPVGKGLLGRIVDALGSPIDGQGPLSYDSRREIESEAPAIIDRRPVTEGLNTGILAIDSMVPIGRGQRELIIGDRQTGKTTIAVDTIINQKGKNVYCVYVAIGQKMSNVVAVAESLRRSGAMNYTTIVAAGASAPVSMQYIAPYSGCAMAEELMYKEHADVLIIYDDLTKHAHSYRAISLLLRRPPGREAFPGDVFYLHSRLLERAARLSEEAGGGSITALPIVETQGGDISAYIPTNVISITDGQIYLETELFFSGVRPAVNVGLSVSRVGGAAQTSAIKRVAGPLRINLAQYRELEAFSQFGSDLDESTRTQLIKGSNITEILKQQKNTPMPVEEQVLILYLANSNRFSCIEREDIKPFFRMFSDYIKSIHQEIFDSIRETGQLTDDNIKSINEYFAEYLLIWQARSEDYGTDI